jgi:hypothetical protein
VVSSDAGCCKYNSDGGFIGNILTASQVEGLLFWGWLGGYKYDGGEIKAGRLLTIEELGEILKSECM